MKVLKSLGRVAFVLGIAVLGFGSTGCGTLGGALGEGVLDSLVGVEQDPVQQEGDNYMKALKEMDKSDSGIRARAH